MFNCERVASCWRKSCLSRGLGLVARLASDWMSSERGPARSCPWNGCILVPMFGTRWG